MGFHKVTRLPQSAFLLFFASRARILAEAAMRTGGKIASTAERFRGYLLLFLLFCSLLFCGLVAVPQPLQAFAPQNSDAPKAGVQHTSTERDGQHDFDFEIGTWKTHVSRLVHPLTGSTTWVEYQGTTVVRKVWNGRANLVELEVDGPAGHIEGLSLRLYNPQSHQWSLNFANSNDGALSQPTVGEFKNGRGEFFDQETLNGRAIFVRFVISDVTANSCRFEQAFSDDGGKTWEVNWVATDTRVTSDSEAFGTNTQPTSGKGDGQHDFDFEIGTWKVHIRRLQHPLSGSTSWIELDGTSVIRKVWNGRANLVELEADGPAGHLEGLSLRLYNPQSHQWSINWATSDSGTLGQPAIGEFKDGRGEFLDQEPFNGRAILVRLLFSDIAQNSCHVEQAYSDDGGKTWEANFVETVTRVKDESDKAR
jgi:hypothetical protein